MKWTVIIPTFNEESCLARCITSVKEFADELLIVDSYSTDTTLEIAKSFDATIIQREYENSASQKNWAIPQAQNQWILLLDADEWLTPALANELRALKSDSSRLKHAGYWIYRANRFLGQPVRYSGLQGDKVIRLFQRDLCRYEPKHVHAEIIAHGSVGKLKGKLNHDTFKGIDQWERKLHRYADWQARDYDQRMGAITLYHTVVKPAWRFVKHFILRGGILDGAIGYKVSYYAAWAVWLRYDKLKAIRAAKSYQ